MKEDLHKKYLQMSLQDLQLEIINLESESHTVKNLIDKVKHEGLYELDKKGISDLTSKLNRKMRFLNHCINAANRVTGIKKAEIKREEHEKTLNSNYELLKLAMENVLSDEQNELVWQEFMMLCEEAR